MDDGLVAPPHPERLQRVFNVPTDLFDQVGLRKNVWKTISMACQPCFVPGGLPELAYTWRLMGVSPSYQERLRKRVDCMKSGVWLVTGPLITYLQGQNGVGLGDQGRLRTLPPPLGEANTYRFYFPEGLMRLRCPVVGCQGGATNRTNLRVQFAHHHM